MSDIYFGENFSSIRSVLSPALEQKKNKKKIRKEDETNVTPI